MISQITRLSGVQRSTSSVSTKYQKDSAKTSSNKYYVNTGSKERGRTGEGVERVKTSK